MSSISRRVWVGVAVVTTASLTLAGIAVYVLVRLALIEAFDRDLDTRAHSAGASVEQDDDGRSFEFHSSSNVTNGFAFIVTDLSGGVIASGGDHTLVDLTSQRLHPHLRRLGDGRAVHQIDLPFRATVEGKTPDPTLLPNVIVHFAADLEPINRESRRVGIIEMGVGFFVIFLSSIATTVIVARALQPLQRMANSVAAVDFRNLSRRVEIDRTPTEMIPVVERLNELLECLGRALDKEKLFTSAIAHELRTPLAGLRTTIQVCLARERPANDYRDALIACEIIGSQMLGLVESLLNLARADAGRIRAASQPVDFVAILHHEWRTCVERAMDRGLQVEWSLGSAMPLADPMLLAMIARNLLDNAVEHAERGAHVRITAASGEGRCRFEVANSKCTLPPEIAPRTFDRLWRADGARADAGRHVGLGLSLCREACTAMGGRIDVTIHDNWFHVLVDIPDAGTKTLLPMDRSSHSSGGPS